MDANRQRLADRILKLLALAAGTPFAAEAESARAMAEDLMARHNIDLPGGAKDRTAFTWEVYVPFAKGAKWEFAIIDAVADLCNCTFFFNLETLANYSLIGTIADLEVLRYMLAELHRQRIAAWLDYKRTGPDSFYKFCFAYAQAMAAKIELLVAARQATLDAHQKQLQLWYETEILKHPAQHAHVEMGRASSEAGLRAGSGASLNRGAIGQPVRRITHG